VRKGFKVEFNSEQRAFNGEEKGVDFSQRKQRSRNHNAVDGFLQGEVGRSQVGEKSLEEGGRDE